jgi:hypothetical protein
MPSNRPSDPKVPIRLPQEILIAWAKESSDVRRIRRRTSQTDEGDPLMRLNRPSDPKVSIRIPQEILAEVDAAAKLERYDCDRKEGRGTRSSIIRRALNVYFNHRLL